MSKVVLCPRCNKTYDQKTIICECGEMLGGIEPTEYNNEEKIEIESDSERAANIILTTSMFVSKREIDYEIEIISHECAYGMNIFRDVFAAVRDVVGGRSKASEKVLQDARKQALAGLRHEAVALDADAVIAVDLDYAELSGGGKSGILLAIATGTAVKLVPLSDSIDERSIEE